MKFLVAAASLSTLVLGASATQSSTSSLVASSNRGFFGVANVSGQGWNIATTIRGGSTGKSGFVNDRPSYIQNVQVCDLCDVAALNIH